MLPTNFAMTWVQDTSDLERRIEAAVEARVSVEVAWPRQEFTKREQMLMTAVMGSQRGRGNSSALWRSSQQCGVKPDLAHEA